LVLTAPLMPPCAHTLCERLTGTSENNSTLPPASATFHRGHQAGQTAADNNHFCFGWCCHKRS
jgi:hypothetical protein